MWLRAAIASVLLAAAGFAVVPGNSTASTLSCAQTADPSTPTSPSPGNPCWTDTTPYPFGFDGNPVDSTSPACLQYETFTGQPDACYLVVDSMAFRAWNRGLAAVSPGAATVSSTPYGLWHYNGSRWYPDATFPGQSACPGDRVLWAGKLDFWLIGQNAITATKWPKLCRFDGVDDAWEPLSVPAAVQASVPQNGQPDSINAGACFAWNNCWFFGSYGVVLHWDGQQLTAGSDGQPGSPWLETDFMAAVAGTDAAGNPFGVAVGATRGSPTHAQNDQLPSDPAGNEPPQLFTSTGGPFVGSAFAPLTVSQPGDPYQTDLVAVAADAGGDTWVAGDPSDFEIKAGGTPAATARGSYPGAVPAPLMPVSSSGSAMPCPGTPADAFTSQDPASTGYLWTSIAVFPGGDALAGGQVAPAQSTGNPEPVLEHVSCGHPPTSTMFRVPDPQATDPSTAPLVPADTFGSITSVAANAVNDAWAATNAEGQFLEQVGPVPAPPHVYHLTDGQTPLAPAGDDHEPRPQVFTPIPTIFVVSPPVVVPAPPPGKTTTKKGRSKRLPPAIFAVRVHLRTGTPGKFTLDITFKVRRSVTIGAEALRAGRVVSASGLRHFRPTRGELKLNLNRHDWPTHLRFVSPSTSSKKAGGG